jgi:molybdopterin synthase catalytic subunit
MTEKALDAIVVEAKSRWEIIDVLVVHRVGYCSPPSRSYSSW